MSEDAPRLTRRQMREQGLLDALPADDATKSPIEKLSETQEINLNRLSRAEMRRQREAEEARKREEETKPAPAEESPERVSVFDRFEEADADATISETPTADVTRVSGVSETTSTDATSTDADADAEARGDDAATEQGSDAADAPGAAPLGDMSLSDRLRSKLREREKAEESTDDSAAEAEAEPSTPSRRRHRASVDPGEQTTDASHVASVQSGDTPNEDTQERQAAEDSGADASRVAEALNSAEHDSLADESGDEPQGPDRLHWLIVAVFILIALLVGVLLGVIVKRAFFSSGVDSSVITTLANTYLASTGFTSALLV